MTASKHVAPAAASCSVPEAMLAIGRNTSTSSSASFFFCEQRHGTELAGGLRATQKQRFGMAIAGLAAAIPHV